MALSKVSWFLRSGSRGSNFLYNRSNFSSSKWESLVGEPVKSPFGNDRRILKSEKEQRSTPADAITITSAMSQKMPFSTSESKKTNEPTVPKFDKKTKCDLSSQKVDPAKVSKTIEQKPVPTESVLKTTEPEEERPALKTHPSNTPFVLKVKNIYKKVPLLNRSYRTVFFYDYIRIDYPKFDSLSYDEQKSILTGLKMKKNTLFGYLYVGYLGVMILFAGVYYAITSDWKNPSDLWANFKSYFLSYYTSIKEPSREILLPPPLPAPYLQPKYTLVLELKDVLVHSKWDFTHGYRYMKRPGLDQFLEMVGYPNFEVVIYSDESPMQDPMIFPSLDPHGKIMYRLYRDCTRWEGGKHVKVLDRLNRDLSKIIFLDTEPRSTEPSNQLLVPKWTGDMNDTALIDLAGLLAAIYMSDVEDVRPVIEHYNSQDTDIITTWRKKVKELEEQRERERQAKQHKSSWSSHYGFSGFRKILG